MSVPALIGTSTHPDSTKHHFHRKVIFDGTYYWVFYWDGSNYVYRYSPTMHTWSDPVVLWDKLYYGRAGGLDVKLYNGIVYVTQLEYTAVGGYRTWFRRGVMGDRVITWDTPVLIRQHSYFHIGGSIERSTTGRLTIPVMEWGYYIWDLYSLDEGKTWYAVSLTNPPVGSNTGGTMVVRMLGGKLMMFMKDGYNTFTANLFNGTSWTGFVLLNKELQTDFSDFSAVARGDIVDTVYLTSGNDLIHRRYTGSWSSEVGVYKNVTPTSVPALLVDDATGDLYCFWAGDPTANHIYYKRRNNATGAWDANPTDWINESIELLTGNGVISAFFRTYGGKRGVIYSTKTASPYNVKIAWFPYVAITPKSADETHVLTELGEVEIIIPAIDKFGEETYPIYEVSGGFKTPHVMPKIFAPVPIAIHSGISFITRNSEIPHERKARDMGRNPIILTTDGKKAHRALREIRPRYGFKVIRGGEVVYRRWEGADLLVWRGQMSLAYLISQGSTGSAVGAFMLVASENSDMPDMGHDSGNPEANEFSPIIGTPITGTWWFDPTVKPTGQYQLSGWLYYEGDVVADRDCTLRKMGIIDTTPTPNRRIITEDRVVDVPILLNDLIRIRYFFPLG